MPATARATGAAAALPPPRILKEKIPASSNTDQATRQTVEQMCRYIRAGVADPIVRAWAEESKRYGGGTTPEALCWGAWWLVKHRVKFARDEPRLFSIGDGDALDLLVAPAVLVRQEHPAEDCDGFTMLLCAILQVLGIQSAIVTVAVDPADPRRWSHVFPMAQLGKQTIPLDCSHGKYPGWMVPAAHVFRWQAWDLDGRAIDLHPSKFEGLHGYTRPGTRMQGLGQDPGIDLGYDPTAAIPVDNPITALGIPPPVPVPSGPPINWGSILSNIIGTAGKVATVAELPAGATVFPSGAISTSPYSAVGTLSAGSALPWLLGIGVLAMFLFSGRGRK